MRSSGGQAGPEYKDARSGGASSQDSLKAITEGIAGMSAFSLPCEEATRHSLQRLGHFHQQQDANGYTPSL